MKTHLMPLLTALVFSGAQTSGTTVPPIRWQTMSRFELKRR